MENKVISHEEIEKFINGHGTMERIVNLSYKYQDDFITVIYRNEKDQKCKHKESFYPFCWATLKACQKLCNGDREELKYLLHKYKIGIKKLSNVSVDGEVRHEFDDGYLFKFFAKEPMSYSQFLGFFRKAGNPIYSKSEDKDLQAKSSSRQYLVVTPQEQYLIASGNRFFKGYDDYDQVLKLTFDLETEGLNTKRDRITHIGMRINRPFLNHPDGFEKVLSIEGNTKEEKDKWELWAIDQMLKVIYTFKPDIITAHNGENFDWNMLIDACERLGSSMDEMSSKYFGGESIRKDERETVLKLGGEMEYYRPTIVPNIIVTDSLHAVRRAQALDSNMLKADLKYVSRYSKIVKPNRVYIPGDKINSTLNDKVNKYAFNNTDGKWYIIDNEHPLKEGYEETTGEYIVHRYLLDDIYECDKVEYRYNTSNFLVCKMLPVPYKKCTTMGTAGQWKALMMAWSYENDLAIPMFGESHSFTGGLSRLLRTGYVKNVVKLDYNSLYPSIILTWGISDPIDLMRIMLHLLEHVLSQREKYKKLKKIAGKSKEKVKSQIEENPNIPNILELKEQFRNFAADEAFNDKKQLPLKIFGNSFFGSYGAPNVFPWGSLKCAEQTTCTGRQCLRLMISHFKNLGYEPIVGDSFTPDTPLFIKYKSSGLIDIVPIEELIDNNSLEIDALGREYDYSKKSYYVLCRSGWVEPTYIYRHKTNKDIYEITECNMRVEVTEDHSLFNCEQEKIKPSEINESTELEYYKGEIKGDGPLTCDARNPHYYAEKLANGEIDRVPIWFLNRASSSYAKDFYDTFMQSYKEDITYSKTCIAGLQFLKNNF